MGRLVMTESQNGATVTTSLDLDSYDTTPPRAPVKKSHELTIAVREITLLLFLIWVTLLGSAIFMGSCLSDMARAARLDRQSVPRSQPAEALR